MPHIHVHLVDLGSIYHENFVCCGSFFFRLAQFFVCFISLFRELSALCVVEHSREDTI